MVSTCSATGCRNRRNKNRPEIRFHRYPHGNPATLQKWIAATGRENWKPSKHSCLCSDHFRPEDYHYPLASGRRNLKQDSVPGIFNHSERLLHVMKCKPLPVRNITGTPIKEVERDTSETELAKVKIEADENVSQSELTKVKIEADDDDAWIRDAVTLQDSNLCEADENMPWPELAKVKIEADDDDDAWIRDTVTSQDSNLCETDENMPWPELAKVKTEDDGVWIKDSVISQESSLCEADENMPRLELAKVKIKLDDDVWIKDSVTSQVSSPCEADTNMPEPELVKVKVEVDGDVWIKEAVNSPWEADENMPWPELVQGKIEGEAICGTVTESQDYEEPPEIEFVSVKVEVKTEDEPGLVLKQEDMLAEETNYLDTSSEEYLNCNAASSVFGFPSRLHRFERPLGALEEREAAALAAAEVKKGKKAARDQPTLKSEGLLVNENAVELDHEYSVGSPQKMKERLDMYRLRVEELKRQLNSAQGEILYKKRKIVSLASMKKGLSRRLHAVHAD